MARWGAAIALRLIETGNRVTVWIAPLAKTAPADRCGRRRGRKRRGVGGRSRRCIDRSHPDAAAIGEVYSGPDGLLAGAVAGKLFIEMSTVRPHIEVALAVKVHAERCRVRRMPGRRHHRPGAPGQAHRTHGRRGGRCRAGAAAARSALPAHRSVRAGRRRIGDEAHHQPAAARRTGKRSAKRWRCAGRSASTPPASSTFWPIPPAGRTSSRCAGRRSPACSGARTPGR